jgi:RNA polymerase sigma factor (sigma-70 family)
VTDPDVARLVTAAASGDGAAWSALVDRFSNLVWAVARGHGLATADAADVAQTAWLRLAEHLGQLREPEKVGAWLATTARFESLRMLRTTRRQVPADLPPGLTGEAPPADHSVIEAERNAALWEAFDTLPMPCKRLLRVLMADPVPSYAEVSAALEMPVGSIGPRRARCLAHLRACLELMDVELPAPAVTGTGGWRP